MKKNVHFLRMITKTIIFLLLLISSSASGQSVIRFEPTRSASGESAYQSHFRKYSLGVIDNMAVSDMLRSTGRFDTLTLVANETSYKFSLNADDIRADNYKLIVQSSSGIEELERTPNMTYLGTTYGEDLPVCITADDHFFTAMIMTRDGAVFIESAKLVNQNAEAGQFVIYLEKDLIKTFKNSVCGAKASSTSVPPTENEEQNRSSQVNCKNMDVAIANDYSMFTKYGSNAYNVQLHNLAVLNLVRTNYDFEFNDDYQHRVLTIYVYTSASGSPWYTGTNYDTLLNSFIAWAPAGFGVSYDVASLWTNRDLDDGVVGLGTVGTICMNACNLLQDFSPNYAYLRVLQAHEMGHNYGYLHDQANNFIMSPSVSNTNTWSQESIDVINTKLSMVNCPGPCPQGTGLGRVGIGTTFPDFSAILDLTSTTKGLLIPRMTPVQREYIPEPAEGLMVYDLGSKSFWFNNGGDWIEMIDNTAFSVMPNNDVTFGMEGNAGIGVATPTNKLDIATEERLNPDSHPTNLPVYITGDSPDYKGMEIRSKDAASGIGISNSSIYASGLNADLSINMISKGPNGNLRFTTNATEHMRVTGYGSVGIGTTIPDASSALEIWSTSKGLLIPRMNTAERNAIASPQLSLLVFDNTTNSYWYKGISGWVELSDNLDTEVFRNGPDKIYLGLTDSVGIGTINPEYKLDVRTANNKYGISHSDGNIKIATWIGNGGEIGTRSNHPFRLFANDGQNQFELLPSGNIGIGVQNASNRWDIHNSVTPRSGTHPVGLATYITGNFGSASNGVEFRSMDAAQGIGFGFNTIYAAGANSSQNLNLAAKGTGGGLFFNTNGAERMSITATGNLGLSVTAPANKLDVQNGTARTGTHNTGQALYVTGGGEFRSADAATGIGIGSNNLFATGVNTNVDLLLAAKGPTGNLSMSTNSVERVKITGTGNVGLSVTAPANKLDVQNGTARTGTHNTGQALYVTGGGEFRSADAATGLAIGTNNLFATGSNTNVDLSLAAKGATGNIILTTNAIEQLRITGAGNIGLGVSAPTNKLDVHAGTARSGTHNTTKALYVTGGSEFRSADATTGLGIGSNNIFATGVNTNVDLTLAGKGATGNILLYTNGLERLRVSGGGNIGIGVTNPNGRLQFASVPENRKIVLFEGANNDNEFIGFGVSGTGALIYQTAHSLNDHIFYSASSSASSTELMRITGTGLVGIGNNTPHAALQLSNAFAQRKLILHETGNNNHQFSGFGVEADKTIRYQVPDENAEHYFAYGIDANTSAELMSIGYINGVKINRSVTLTGNMTMSGNLIVNGSINGAITTEAFIEPTLINGFSNFGNDYATAAYYKDKMGVVHLRGTVTRGANHNGITIFVLPAGYRPSTSGKLLFTTQATAGLSRIDILPDGNVVVTAPSSGWISLDGITFRAD